MGGPRRRLGGNKTSIGGGNWGVYEVGVVEVGWRSSKKQPLTRHFSQKQPLKAARNASSSRHTMRADTQADDRAMLAA